MINRTRIVFWITILFVLNIFADVVVARSTSTSFQIEQCIQSYDVFAYRSSGKQSEENTLYGPQWQIEGELPRKEVPNSLVFYYQDLSVSLTRMYAGQPEIWIAGYTAGEMKRVPTIMVFRPNSKDWEYITPNIDDTGLYAKDLFLDSNNVIWGRTIWEPFQESKFNIDHSPILSRFNENTQHFELAKGAPEVPLVKYNSGSEAVVISDPNTRIILDNNDIFWIFVQKDGICRYDPSTQITEQKAYFPAFIHSAALSSDGSIYFSIYGNQASRGLGPFMFQEGSLLRFIPQTGKVESLGTPDDTWPMFNGMLFDHQGRLWLGSIGYLEASGTWHLTHPGAVDYLANAEALSWQLPSPILASSDGRLWFKQYLDGERGQGTAWYDPQKDEGCWFTTYPTNIVEDANQQLWMMGEHGRLYKYALNSP